MRALERVHSGANGALATLAHLAPEVWLVVPVEKRRHRANAFRLPGLGRMVESSFPYLAVRPP